MQCVRLKLIPIRSEFRPDQLHKVREFRRNHAGREVHNVFLSTIPREYIKFIESDHRSDCSP